MEFLTTTKLLTGTKHSSVSLLRFVPVFLKQTLSAEMKNSQVIQRILLSILENFFKKARAILKWQNNPHNNLAIFQFCTQYLNDIFDMKH